MTVCIIDPDAAFYAAKLRESFPAIALTDDPQSARVLIGLAPYLRPEHVGPELEWVQALTTGVDNLMTLDAAITNCAGIHGPQMSELAIMLMLALQRDLPVMIDSQRSGGWERRPQPLLHGKTVCIVGLGAIALHLAGICAAFGMTVTGVSSRENVPGFVRIHPRKAMPDAFGAADFVVVLSPYSADTHHLINAPALAAMKRSAFLINLSRGGCVDEAALQSALEQGLIAGAGLDVFAVEPLSPDSALRTLPNVIITPHIGGFSDTYKAQALPTVLRNMADYLVGGVQALKGRIK